MDSDSPPRKKLKQARLPFQILSHKESTPESVSSTSSRKRPLSEDSHDDDVVVVKAVKKSEDCGKSEETIRLPHKAEDVKDEKCSEESETVTLENNVSSSNNEPLHGEKDKENTESKEGSSLQSKMKSTLANLFGKKVFDVTAEVGSCDCGCEEANSDDEALEEYMEHCKKGKAGQSKVAKKPRQRSKKKEEGTSENGTAKPSPKTKSPRAPKNPKTSKSPKSPKKKDEEVHKSVDTVNVAKSDKITPQKSAECATLKSELAEASGNEEESKMELNKTSILSQKAQSMFAKWKKESNTDISGIEGTATLPGKDEVKTECKSPSKCNDGIKVEAIMTAKKEPLEEKVNSITENEDHKISGQKVFGADELSNVSTKKSAQEIAAYLVKPIKQVCTASEMNKKSTDFSKASSGEEESSGSADLSIVLDVEKPSCPLTPTNISKTSQRRLTPKQLERQKEVAKKQEEKERLKLEKESEKKRLKQEKDEQKRKEKEEKEEQRRKEKEEKQNKKQAEQEQKNEEKKKKAEEKAEEKRKKEEEKRKAEEDEERKKAKASVLITSFFVPKSAKMDREDAQSISSTVQNFMPFEVKADMRIAPRVRLTLSSPQKRSLDELFRADCDRHSDSLYLCTLKSGKVTPHSTSRTWPLDETKEEDDICILESNDAGALIPNGKKIEKMRAKFLQFHENHRPAYRGTWRKKSHVVTGRHPYGKDKILDYEVDSADEWEEEEPGESLHGSDDEKEQESEDEYEVDNTVFVPHGYLSDDEGDGDESEDILSPETQKAKLKLLGEEFEAQMKSKTSALKPIIIVLTAALQASSFGSARYQKLFERRAVWREDEGPINLLEIGNDSDSIEGQSLLTSDPNCVTFSTGPGAKKKLFSDEALPALITLVHGNQNKRVFLTHEFSAFLAKSGAVNVEDADNDSNVEKSEGSAPPLRPSTPSASGPNPLTLKWPGLPPASRISISNKIKEIATWGPCPEEGPMLNRQCWFVTQEFREKYGLNDLKVPNTAWIYSLKPKLLKHSQSPNAAGNTSNGSGADSRALITKFTKVMTPEEKQRQWESMKSSASKTPTSLKQTTKGSAGKITSFAQYARTPSSTESKEVTKPQILSTTPTSSSQLQAKKRVPLLVSVPRGQEITGPTHCSLLSRFEASISSHDTASAPTASEDITKEKNEDCIVLD